MLSPNEELESFQKEVSEWASTSSKQILKIAQRHSDGLRRRERQIEDLEQDLKRRKVDLEEKEKDLLQQQSEIDFTMQQLHTMAEKAKNKIKLNIGGTVFTTTIDTMVSERDTFFSAMFSGKFNTSPDDDGEYFIDRDATHFDIILNHLRGVDVSSKIKELKGSQKDLLQEEVTFYGIASLHDKMLGTFRFQEGIAIVDQYNENTKKIRWGIKQWEKVASKCYSDEFMIGNRSLRVLFICNKDPKYLAVYVTRGENETEEFYVRFRVTLVNLKEPTKSHSTELAEVVLNKKHYDWGWRKLLLTSEVSKGFSTNGNLMFEVVVTTDTDRNDDITEFFRYKAGV